MPTDTTDPVEEFRQALAAHLEHEARRCITGWPQDARTLHAAATIVRTFTTEEKS